MNAKQLIVILIGTLIVGMILAGISIKTSLKERPDQKYSEFERLTKDTIAPFVPPSSPDSRGWVNEGPIYQENLMYEHDKSFKAFTQRIPELKELGIKTIYFIPIWEHDPTTPFVIDYYKINPLHGDEKDLHELIETAHRNDMKVIFDLITAIASEKSVIYQEHPEWFLHDRRGKILNHYPHKSWGPAIDRTNPEVIDYFAEIAKYYVQEYDIDGWRIDAPQNNYDPAVTSEDHSMVEMLRKIKQEITNIKSDAILITELPGPLCECNPGCEPVFDEISEATYDWFLIGSLRPDISDLKLLIIRHNIPELKKYPFYYTGFVNELITNKATSEDLVRYFYNERIWHNRTRVRYIEFHNPYRVQLAFPDQHKSLLVLISTIPGVPMICNGQEIGEINTWACNRDKGDYELWKFYKRVFKIRRENDALKYGSMTNVWSGGDNTYAYLRSYNGNHVITVINFYEHAVNSTLSLPVNNMEIDLNAKYTLYDALSNESFFVNGLELSNLKVNLSAYGARILILQNR